MRSTKDQLVEKDVLMPVKNTMFSCGTFRMSKRCLHMMERKLSSSEKIMICLISIYLSYSPLSVPFFFVCFRFSSGLHGNTAADSVQSEWPLGHAAKSNTVFAQAQLIRTETVKL
ncbi:hypothetical protein TNCV_3460011 [Trichonephila clavipes]|nr:hypothetical protein TNCV_3460011 [Trichonephila clavipes]